MSRSELSPNEMLDSILRQIAPLWGLNDFVAVNPFLGETNQHFLDAARERKKISGHSTLPSLPYFRRQWAQGNISDPSRKRFHHDERTSPAFSANLRQLLESDSIPSSTIADEVRTLIECYDQQAETSFQWEISRWVGKMCSAHQSEGIYWRAASGSSLYTFFRKYLGEDRTLEILGLRGLRRLAQTLPESIEEAFKKYFNPKTENQKYLKRLILQVPGWGAHFRRLVWGKEDHGLNDLLDLAIILLVLDKEISKILHNLQPRDYKPRPVGLVRERDEGAEEERYQLLSLTEAHYLENLKSRFLQRRVDEIESPRSPEVQAVFCIDVRSEPMRRAIESYSSRIDTLGFAGFFGLPLAVVQDDEASARCPVLLNPQYEVALNERTTNVKRIGLREEFKKSGSTPLSYVEYCGWMFGVEIFKDLVGARSIEDVDHNTILESESLIEFIPKLERAPLAAQILKNLSVGEQLAPIVVFLGHSSSHANHAHYAGLQCGACGGHGGGINARMAAELLNDRNVREELATIGIRVPDSTVFLSGVHDTTLEKIYLHPSLASTNASPQAMDVLKGALEQASEKVRQERSKSEPTSSKGRSKLFLRRSRDWSETRPEWGLARNAAFVAARRSRTREADLEGRVFLHEYDSLQDPEGGVLSLILSAPVIVASWINLQYYASTVDNEKYGSGTKTLHNRVGTRGVVSGNGGDLRTGLSEQSVFTAQGEPYHEPLRLQVIVEAPLEKLTNTLANLENVSMLVKNEWIKLFALERDSNILHRVSV